tara:strand:+ start:1050 stop:3344 length:2295 start_codon:yes stop_codon:yes gene_type:complete
MSSEHSTENIYSGNQIKQKLTKTRKTAFVILLSFILITTLQVYYLSQKTSSNFADNITVVALFNVLLILLFILLVLITRNLVKLYNERKSKIIGSKFQTKLIIAFFILALVPSLLLFVVASKLFSYSIGNWFSLQVKQSLDQSLYVAQEYYSLIEKTSRAQAKNIERMVTDSQLYEKKSHGLLKESLETKRNEYKLGAIIIYDEKGKFVTSVGKDDLKLFSISHGDLIEKSVGDEPITETRSLGDRTFFITVLPLTQTLEKNLIIWGYMMTLTPVSTTTIYKIENIKNNFEDYQKQSLLKLPVTANYYITFLMITLLILFSAVWLGIYMAKGITVPIQQLAKGTRRIAKGDMNFKVDVQANDEISLLVDSFNTMMEEINESRRKIQEGAEDLKQTNIELDRRRKHIETILENIGAGVISINKKGQISTLNKAAQTILNISDTDVLGASYRDVFDPSFQDPIRSLIRKVNADQNESIEEQIELMVGNLTLTLLVNINVLRDSSWKYLGLVIVFEDLTQMIKTQKIAAWKEVAQGIAHEIKNPLTPIQLNTQRLVKKFHENKEDFARIFDESILIITQEVQGMKELLDQFLKFSRMPTPMPKPESLHKIIDSVAALYANPEKNILFRKNYDPNLNLINLDAEQFRRVFINLFENAQDAIEGQGAIEVATRLHKQKKKVSIEFSDTGTGINPSERDKLFLPYYTTKKRGTGLGLAIVNRIIADHNGNIEVRNNSPRGTILAIELPYTPAHLQVMSRQKNYTQTGTET